MEPQDSELSKLLAAQDVPITEEAKDKHIVRLVLYKHEAQKKIEELESTLKKMKPSLMESSVEEMVACTMQRQQLYSAAMSGCNGSDEAVGQVSMWNNELIEVIDKLNSTLKRVETEATENLTKMTHRMENLMYENASLMDENDSLKERVADDVLQKRLAKRIEVAAEKARIASLVRSAGLRRLEYMEGNLMEAHDDLYHTQRHDAVDLPRRDVCFVFQYVGNLKFPLQPEEEVTYNVSRQIMANNQRKRNGHLVACYRGMDVFVFQDPLAALDFAQACHIQILQFRRHERDDLPHFNSVYQQGVLVFRGPRLHTCIFACTPEVTVDPVSGNSVYFGPEVKAAVSAALQFSGVGEIVVNKTWASLLCRRQRYQTDSNVPVDASAADVRQSLGKDWEVTDMPGAGGVVLSLLPMRLKERRLVDPSALRPSPKYPCMEIDLQEGVQGLMKALKCADESAKHKRHIWSTFSLEDAMQSDDVSGATRMLEYFTLKQEKDSITELYNDLQRSSESFERDLMAKEDRYEIANRSPLDPSETVYVCTVDFGDDAFWKLIVVPTMTLEEYNSLRNSIRCYIHTKAKTYFGFLMNGNDVDIFTYVFRGVEAAFSFVSDVYIMVNRTGTKCSHATQGSGQDIFFLRAGISSGPMSSIFRVKDKGASDSVKCTGAIIRLSGALCDLSQNGEILCTDDVINTFLSVNENLLGAQFNILRQRGQILSGPAAIHSILPKPFAYRRKQLCSAEKEGRRPSRCAAATLETRRTEYSSAMVEDLMEQQRTQLETVEASLMAAQDKPVYHVADLKNPWFVLSQGITPLQPYGTHPSYRPPLKPLAFLFCDVLSSTQLEKELPSTVLVGMYGHYNWIVQEVCQRFGGFIARTNGKAAYLVLFQTVFEAMSAATLLQQRLVRSSWPEEMKTSEPCLFVRDAKSGDVVFNGPRVQVAVHESNNFTWKKGTSSAASTSYTLLELSGPAIEELCYLGYHARGGEIRFSRQCVTSLSTTAGKRMLDQLLIEVLPSVQYTNIPSRRSSVSSVKKSEGGPSRRRSSSINLPKSTVSIEALSAVPVSIAARMPFLLPGGTWQKAVPGSPNSVEAPPKMVPVPPFSSTQIKWILGAEGASDHLPLAEKGSWGVPHDPTPPEARDIQFFLEHILSKFPPAVPGSMVDSSTIKSWPSLGTSYLNFMRFSKEILSYVTKAFNFANDKRKAPPLPKINVAKPKSQTVSLPPVPTRGGSRIPTAPQPPSVPKQKRDQDTYDDGIEYINEACKTMTKLRSLQV